MTNQDKNQPAATLGRLGGSSKSDTKATAAIANGRFGGRPRRVPFILKVNGTTYDMKRDEKKPIETLQSGLTGRSRTKYECVTATGKRYYRWISGAAIRVMIPNEASIYADDMTIEVAPPYAMSESGALIPRLTRPPVRRQTLEEEANEME